MNISNLSVRPGFDLWYFANGHITYGYSIKKVGDKQSTSKYSAINLSTSLAVVLGVLQATFNSLHKSSKNF